MTISLRGKIPCSLLQGIFNRQVIHDVARYSGAMEYLLNASWSLKLEYTYCDMGDEDVTFTPNDRSPAEFWNVDQAFNLIKFGVNYQF